MKFFLLFFCLFMGLSLNAVAYSAEADAEEELKPWEVMLKGAKEKVFVESGTIKLNVDLDAYKEAVAALELYIAEGEFSADEFVYLVDDVNYIAEYTYRDYAKSDILLFAINEAQKAPPEQYSAIVDLWLRMISAADDDEMFNLAVEQSMNMARAIYPSNSPEFFSAGASAVRRISKEGNRMLAVTLVEGLLNQAMMTLPIEHEIRFEIGLQRLLLTLSSRQNPEDAILAFIDSMKDMDKSVDHVRHEALVRLAKLYYETERESEIPSIIESITSLNIDGQKTFEIIYAKPPSYPQRALNEGLGGQVMLKFSVDSKGSAFDVKVLSSTHSMFNTRSVKAIEKSIFIPPYIDGKPSEHNENLMMHVFLIED